MFEQNVALVLDRISSSDVVVDIGGWARPFNYATHVMDAQPYDTRGRYGTPQGGPQERFDASTWIQRDICSHEQYPFDDKTVDFVICSHTLEDVRDPIWVCSEMIRIAKRGYIEVPSRLAESCRGVEPGQVGWSHHRWLIEIADSDVTFLMKYHMIHSRKRYSLPASYLRNLSPSDRVQWLFWDEQFSYRERTIHGLGNIAEELERFVELVHPYSRLHLAGDAALHQVHGFAHRVHRKISRLLGKSWHENS